jgi:hypothetical protein
MNSSSVLACPLLIMAAVFLAFRRAYHDPWVVTPCPQQLEPLAA